MCEHKLGESGPCSIEVRGRPEGNKGEERTCRLQHHSNGVLRSDDRESAGYHTHEDVGREKRYSSQEVHLSPFPVYCRLCDLPVLHHLTRDEHLEDNNDH